MSDLNTAYKGGNNNGRSVQGLSVVKTFLDVSAKYTSPLKTARGVAGKGSTTAGGPKGTRTQKMGKGEVCGPAQYPKATMPAASPESQKTQANTKFILPSVSSQGSFRGEGGGKF